MRLAFSTLGCPGWSLEQAADAACRYGYAGLELRLLDGAIIEPSLEAAQRRRIRRVCADAGLTICGLGTSFRVADPRADLADAYAALDLAAELGAPLIRLFGGAPAGEAWEATRARAAERLGQIGNRGRELGVLAALETHDSFAAGRLVADIFATVEEPGAGVIWDTLHPLREGEPPEETLALIGDRLLHMHVKDGAAPPDLSECRLLGEGRVPVAAILRMLAGRGYAGWLSVEWEKHWQPQIAAPEVALPQYAATLRAYLQTIAG